MGFKTNLLIMKVTNMDFIQIADGWIRYTNLSEADREGNDDFLYWDKLFVLSMNMSDFAIRIICEILRREITAEQRCELAAGPVEEFLASATNIDELELNSEKETLFRSLKPLIWPKRFHPEIKKWLIEI